MEHCTTSIIQDDLSELFEENDFSAEIVDDLITKIKNAIRSLEDLKLAGQGTIHFYEEVENKSPQLERALKQLERLI
jgi:hypothetical protein